MRLGIVADVHGNDVALRAVLEDAARFHVDRWWVLGDLVLFGRRRHPNAAYVQRVLTVGYE